MESLNSDIIYDRITELGIRDIFSGDVYFVRGIPHMKIPTIETVVTIPRWTTRKWVVIGEKVVLKTGHNGFMFYESDGAWDTPQKWIERNDDLQIEYKSAINDCDIGLPTVRPVLVAFAEKENEYLMVEPKGLDVHPYLDDLLKDHAGREGEIAKTVDALGRMFGSMNALGYTYEPNSKEDLDFEHLLRFDQGDRYEILITDSPGFDTINDNKPDPYQLKVLTSIKQQVRYKFSLDKIVSRSFKEGYNSAITGPTAVK